MSAKTACVVGAGSAGIAALKECLRQGFKSTCYELDSDIGGTWRKKDYTKPTNTPAVWDSLITNSSKFNTCYSDFPPHPDDTPYLTAEATYKYFKRAVEHYGLEKYIHLNTRVIQIRKTKHHEQTGQWEVYTTVSGNEIAGNDTAGPRGNENALASCHREVFDYVFVCSGYFKIPMYPNVPGLDKFKGTVQHAFSYTNAKPYDDRTVLVVGNKLSAADIASDIANRAKQVYLACGGGMWIIPRCFSNARPLDLLFPRCVMHARDAAVRINNRLIQEAESKIDHVATGIRPDKPPLFSPFGLSDDLPLQMLSGRVKVYGYLTRLEGDNAHFSDGHVISGIDAIVFCTGYKPDLSFLDLKIFEESGKMELYRMIFPLDQTHNTLALIGIVAGDAPLAVLFEAQVRLAILVMAGKYRLPSRDRMKKDIDFWNGNAIARRGKYTSYFVNVAILTESIADEIGCYPTFWKVFLKDPILAFRNWYGPVFAAQYRLLGPDSQWNEASKTCYALYEEGYTSLRHMEIKSYQRLDVCDYYKAQVVTVLSFSTISAVVGFLLYKYQEKILQFWSF